MGLVIIFGYLNVTNMAHGSMMMVGGFAGFVLMQNIKLPFGIAIIGAFLITGLLGMVIEKLIIKRLYSKPTETILATYAISIILTEAARMIWPLSQNVDMPIPGSLTIGGVVIPYYNIFVLVFAAVLLTLVLLMFKDFIINMQKYTNGFNGLQSIKRFAINGGDPLSKTAYYYVILAVAVLVFLFCLWLTHSRFGKVSVSIRENESRLGFFGYDTAKYKIIIYTISGALAGLAGVLYAPATSTITTEDIGVTASAMVVVWVAVGGRGNLTGAVFGALLINWLQSLLSEHFSGVWQLIIGALLLVIIFFIPNGIIGQLVSLQRRIISAKAKAAAVELTSDAEAASPAE